MPRPDVEIQTGEPFWEKKNKLAAVVGDYINAMKTTYLFKFWLFTSCFRISSLQVIKEKLF